MKIRCHTLYDITRTNINTRRQHTNLIGQELAAWNFQRSQQSNYETLLQIVGLRAQPEELSDPESYETIPSTVDYWGQVYDREKEPISCWSFTFIVNHGSLFNNGITELGSLDEDSNGVPMITGLGEQAKLPNHLDVSDAQRNIYWEVIEDE